MVDPYEALGLSPQADEKEIRERYLELVREFPPDRARNGSRRSAPRMNNCAIRPSACGRCCSAWARKIRSPP